MKHRIFYMLFIGMFAACNTGADGDIRAAIARQNRKLHEVVQTKNIKLLDEVYHEQACFLPPGDTAVYGIKNIKAKWSLGLTTMKDMRSVTWEIIGHGDIVSEVGEVHTIIATPDSNFIYKAKYNNVWQRNDKGQYLLKVDIWNSIE